MHSYPVSCMWHNLWKYSLNHFKRFSESHCDRQRCIDFAWLPRWRWSAHCSAAPANTRFNHFLTFCIHAWHICCCRNRWVFLEVATWGVLSAFATHFASLLFLLRLSRVNNPSHLLPPPVSLRGFPFAPSVRLSFMSTALATLDFFIVVTQHTAIAYNLSIWQKCRWHGQIRKAFCVLLPPQTSDALGCW